MRIDDFPEDIRSRLIPEPTGQMVYRCLGCRQEYGIEELLYTCPQCRQVLLLHDADFERVKATAGETWRRIFDYRKMLNIPALKGIFRYHEFIGPVIPLSALVCLGEGSSLVSDARKHR